MFGAVFIIGGIIGSGLFGWYVEVSKAYKKALLFITLIAVIAPFFFFIALKSETSWLTTLSCLVLGLELAILPIGIDFAVELTFPIAESISTGLLMTMS